MQRDATLTTNAYSRFLSQKRGARSYADLERGMTRNLEGLASNHAQRGLANSGIYKQAQTNYGQEWMQQRQDITDQVGEQLRQADFGDSQAWSQYQMTDADLAMQKQADILATAAQLQQFQPFLGA